MPYADRAVRKQLIDKLRAERHAKGLCVQCGESVARYNKKLGEISTINPITEENYWLCDETKNNCQGKSNAAVTRSKRRKKERERNAQTSVREPDYY